MCVKFKIKLFVDIIDA